MLSIDLASQLAALKTTRYFFSGVLAAAAGAAAVANAPHRVRPRLKVKNWWSGGYVTEAAAAVAPAADAPPMKKVFPGVYVSSNLGEALQGLKGLEGLAPPEEPPEEDAE